MKIKFKNLAVFAISVLLLSACGKDEPNGNGEDPQRPDTPVTPATPSGSLQETMVGTWMSEIIESNGSIIERSEVKFADDKSGVIKVSKNGTVLFTSTFTWSVKESTRLITMKLDNGETDQWQILAISPEYSIIANASDEHLYKRTAGKSNYQVAGSDYQLLGTWEGYIESNGVRKLELELNADGSGSFTMYDSNGRIVKYEDAMWMPGTQNNVSIFYLDKEDYDFDEDNYTILRADSKSMTVYTTNYKEDIVSFIKHGTSKRLTADDLLGNWLNDYHWSDNRNLWNYDEIKVVKGGTGSYIENAPTPNPDKVSFTWTFNAQAQSLSLCMPNGEYGYKDDEPEFEYMTLNFLLANESLIFAMEEDELQVIMRK